MAIEPKNTREHIISLYGHVTGLKKDISQIKNNHLKHIHEDVEKLGGFSCCGISGHLCFGKNH
jgi:hypothetical protein